MSDAQKRDRTFLLEGIPLFQWLLRGPAWQAFFRLAIPGTVMVLLSIPAGVASIPALHNTGYAQNLGFLFRNNWTWPYIVVWPVSLLLLRRLSENIRNSVADLEEMRVLVPAGGVGRSFMGELTRRLGSSGTSVWVWSVVAILSFTVFDTLEIARGYLAYAAVPSDSGLCPYVFTEVDWSVAFVTRCWTDVLAGSDYQAPGILRNAAFNTVVYAVQSLLITSYFIFFIRLTQFFFVFSSSLRGSEFTLVPMYDDPMKRLGLGPLGRAYNLFLTLILIFETYIAAHRFQQVSLLRGESPVAYLRELIVVASQPDRWLDPSVHAFSTLDVGTIVLMVAVVLPMTLVCWFPLFRLRAYIHERKLEMTKEWAIKRAKAQEEGNDAEAERYARRVALLDEANVWPNGDAAAQRFLLAMAVIWLGALFPVVFVSAALGAFGILEAIRLFAWIWDKLRGKKAAAPA